ALPTRPEPAGSSVGRRSPLSPESDAHEIKRRSARPLDADHLRLVDEMAVFRDSLDGATDGGFRRLMRDEDHRFLVVGALSTSVLHDRFQRDVAVGHTLGDRGKDADTVVHGQAYEIATGMRSHLCPVVRL